MSFSNTQICTLYKRTVFIVFTVQERSHISLTHFPTIKVHITGVGSVVLWRIRSPFGDFGLLTLLSMWGALSTNLGVSSKREANTRMWFYKVC